MCFKAISVWATRAELSGPNGPTLTAVIEFLHCFYQTSLYSFLGEHKDFHKCLQNVSLMFFQSVLGKESVRTLISSSLD